MAGAETLAELEHALQRKLISRSRTTSSTSGASKLPNVARSNFDTDDLLSSARISSRDIDARLVVAIRSRELTERVKYSADPV